MIGRRSDGKMLKNIFAGLAVIAIAGFAAWLAGGNLISALEGVPLAEFRETTAALREEMKQMRLDIKTEREKEAKASKKQIRIFSGAATATSDPSIWQNMQDQSIIYSYPVNFDTPFAAPPKVIIAIHAIDIFDLQDIQIVKLSAETVLPTGFKLHFRVSPATNIPNLRAHWLAYGPQ